MATYFANDVQKEVEYKYGYEFILIGIIDRIKNQLNELGIPFDENIINQIYNFLNPIVDGKVWIMFVKDLPEITGYSYTSVELESHTLNLAFGMNTIESRFPNALYVSINTDYEKMFKKLWIKNYFPKVIFEESIKHLDLSKHIDIYVYERPSLWKKMLKTARNPIIIGQELDENGNFLPRKSIGFVDGQVLCFTAPNECYDNMGITITFN